MKSRGVFLICLLAIADLAVAASSGYVVTDGYQAISGRASESGVVYVGEEPVDIFEREDGSCGSQGHGGFKSSFQGRGAVI